MLYLLSLLFLICGVNLLYVTYNGIDLGIMAVALLLLALVTLSLGSIINDYSQLINYLVEGKIRQKEEELKHIGESIDLFYLPLLDLLTKYDENVAVEPRPEG